jgi:hypothetical protein
MRAHVEIKILPVDNRILDAIANNQDTLPRLLGVRDLRKEYTPAVISNRLSYLTKIGRIQPVGDKWRLL